MEFFPSYENFFFEFFSKSKISKTIPLSLEDYYKVFTFSKGE